MPKIVRSLGYAIGLLWALALIVGANSVGARDVPVTLAVRILATTDIHSNLMDYDYYRDQPDISVGLVRTASLIKAARQEQPNNLLLDAGDLLQGTLLADMVQQRGLPSGFSFSANVIHPDFTLMNRLGYDAAVIGNHEFNFGLGYLEAALKGAKFPYVSANLMRVDRGKPRPLVAPGIILKRRFKDILGQVRQVQVGIVGATPPQIMTWDRDKLIGKLEARDMLSSVRDSVTKLKADGADVIIVLAHTGIGSANAGKMDENVGYQFTKLRGVDAVVLGHSHQVFPSDSYANVPDVDLSQGKINGKPVVMAGYFGSHLGVIDLVLKRQGKRFAVVSSYAETRAITKQIDGRRVAAVEADPAMVKLVEPAHRETIAYAKKPLAKTATRIHTYLALLGDNHALALVQDAQRSYVQNKVKGTAFESLPLLSAVSVFKAGGRYGVANYTDIAPGDVQVRNIADLYLYPNTISVVKVTGAELREWLEMSTRIFNQIDPAKAELQALIDLRVPSFNFDVIDGITYGIDLSQPARYDTKGKLVRPDSRRIKDLMHEGRPIGEDEVFLVAVGNYRADGGGDFPGLDGSKTVLAWPDTIQDIIAADMKSKGEVRIAPRPIWHFTAMDPSVRATFDVPSREVAIAATDPRLEKDTDLGSGMTRYRLNLSAGDQAR